MRYAAALTCALCAVVLAPRRAAPAVEQSKPKEPAAAASAPEGAPFDMESFQLVLLVRAPTWKKLPDEEAKALQSAHLAHLEKMWQTGKAVVCGPFDNQADPAFRGACVYAVKTVEEARELAGQDPVVKAGQLRVEVMTWWVGKGYMTFPKTPAAKKGG
jgi:uncharacterized protein YciI